MANNDPRCVEDIAADLDIPASGYVGYELAGTGDPDGDATLFGERAPWMSLLWADVRAVERIAHMTANEVWCFEEWLKNCSVRDMESHQRLIPRRTRPLSKSQIDRVLRSARRKAVKVQHRAGLITVIVESQGWSGLQWIMDGE